MMHSGLAKKVRSLVYPWKESMKNAGLISLFLVFSAILTLPAAAAPKTVANYRDWVVYKQDIGGDTVCYAVTEPTDMSPNSVNHGNVFFLVSSWESGVASNQPSLMTGYALRDAPEPTVRIGSDKWEMFTAESEGFIDKKADEERLVAAMRRGSDMRITAVSDRGTATNYTFSLIGISDALDRAASECQE